VGIAGTFSSPSALWSTMYQVTLAVVAAGVAASRLRSNGCSPLSAAPRQTRRHGRNVLTVDVSRAPTPSPLSAPLRTQAPEGLASLMLQCKFSTH